MTLKLWKAAATVVNPDETLGKPVENRHKTHVTRMETLETASNSFGKFPSKFTHYSPLC